MCGHCGEQMRGHASISDANGVAWLCHPDEGQDCYHLVTVWGHDPYPGCRQCEADREERERVADLPDAATLERLRRLGEEHKAVVERARKRPHSPRLPTRPGVEPIW